MSTDSGPGWRAGFKTDYQTIFVDEWSPFVGALLRVPVITGLLFLWYALLRHNESTEKFTLL